MAGKKTGKKRERMVKSRKLKSLPVGEEARQLVERMVAFGESPDTIGKAIGRVPASLQRMYSQELKYGRSRQLAKLVNALFESALGGNATTLKYLAERVGMTETIREASTEVPEAVVKAMRLGKKEAALLAARTPDTSTDMGRLLADRQKYIDVVAEVIQ